jgi:hypothetical protein
MANPDGPFDAKACFVGVKM